MTERKTPLPGDLVILSHPSWNCLLYSEPYLATSAMGVVPGLESHFVNGEMKYGEVAIVIDTLNSSACVCNIITSKLRSGWLRLEYVAKAKNIL